MSTPPPSSLAVWQQFLANCTEAAGNTHPLMPAGHLTRINGLVMEAAGLKLPLGSSCRVLPPGGSPVEAEVVGFNGEKLFLMPSDDVYGLSPGAAVVALETPSPPPLVGKPPPSAAVQWTRPSWFRSAWAFWDGWSMAPAVPWTVSAPSMRKPCAPCTAGR